MSQVIIDVREPIEYKTGHVKGAINIPVSRIHAARELEDIEKETEIICYCRSGSRSGMAITILSRLGYTNLTNGIHKANVEARYL